MWYCTLLIHAPLNATEANRKIILLTLFWNLSCSFILHIQTSYFHKYIHAAIIKKNYETYHTQWIDKGINNRLKKTINGDLNQWFSTFPGS
jgi:hypothetical protein